VARTILHLYTQVTRISHEELFLSAEDQANLMKDHEAIYLAIASHDAEKARTLMQNHLNRVTLKTTSDPRMHPNI
jgi:DNA-binding FadR family transcriptional regulator